MRGPLDGDVIEDLNRAISVLDLNLATITGMLGSARLLELDAPTRTELGRFAKTLHDVGEGASRAAMLIDKANTDADADLALEWDLQRHLADGFTSCRGLSTRTHGDIKAGTTFHVDDVWRGENGVLIGVIWHDRARTFEWLTPLELKSWTRPLSESQGMDIHA